MDAIVNVLPAGVIALLIGLWGIFRRPAPTNTPQHGLSIHLSLDGESHGTESEREGVFALEGRLESALGRAGEVDGNLFGGGEAVIYIYGQDADQMWSAVRDVVESYPVLPGSFAVKEYGSYEEGPPPQEKIVLG